MITDPSAPLAVIVRMTKSPFFAVSTSPTLSPGAVVVWTILYFTPDSVDPSNPTVPGSALPSARAGAAVFESGALSLARYDTDRGTITSETVVLCVSMSERRAGE